MLMRIFAVFAIAVQLTNAAENVGVTEAKLRNYFEQSEVDRANEIKELERLLSLAKNGRVSSNSQKTGLIEVSGRKRFVFRSVDARKQKVKEITFRLNDLRITKTSLPRLSVLPNKMKVGYVGVLPPNNAILEDNMSRSFRVRQVVDSESVLVGARHHRSDRVEVVGNRAITIEGFDGTSYFWLKRLTKGLVDDSPIDLSEGAYKITGTKRYTTISGSTNTVFVLESFDASPYLDVLEERNPLHTVRVWRDVTGKFNVEAEFIGLDSGVVTLKRKDNGKELKVSLEKLSKADQEFIRSNRSG